MQYYIQDRYSFLWTRRVGGPEMPFLGSRVKQICFIFFVSYPIEFWFPVQIRSLASPLGQPYFSYLAHLFGDDRREVYRILQEEGIDLPRYAVLNRDPACPEGEYLAVSDCSLLDIHDLS